MFNEAQQCICCAATFSLSNGSCVAATTPVTNCSCQVADTCVACLEGFDLVDGVCVAVSGRPYLGCNANQNLSEAICVMC